MTNNILVANDGESVPVERKTFELAKEVAATLQSQLSPWKSNRRKGIQPLLNQLPRTSGPDHCSALYICFVKK